MNIRKRRSDRSGRVRLFSPGRPPVAGREERRRFWAAIAAVTASEDAAVGVGVPQAVGTRWFRKAGVSRTRRRIWRIRLYTPFAPLPLASTRCLIEDAVGDLRGPASHVTARASGETPLNRSRKSAGICVIASGVGREMQTAGSESKLPVLDGLRAISILLVLACHLLPLGPKALRLNETAGAMGMSLFFALSGFLITSGLMKNPNVQDFIERRLARILPLVYAYTMVVFLGLSFNPRILLWTNLFTVNYLSEYLDPGWSAHLWSLCVEIHFYLAIALVVLLFRQKGLWIVWPACLAITLMRVSSGTYISIVTHLRVDEILSGACTATAFAYLGGSRRTSGDLKLLSLVIGSAALFWAICSYPLSGYLQYARPYATAFLLFASLKYGAANPETLLGSWPARYIGTISYALYIIHPATAHGWMSEGGAVTKYLFKRPISFALSFLLAHLSTFYWERPWQMAIKRRIQRRRQSSFIQVAGPRHRQGGQDSASCISRSEGMLRPWYGSVPPSERRRVI
jgi:peptidoglycan/LPS O-acetylase OafA/YrhL